MKITMTNGSKSNGVTGSRIRITASDGVLLEQIILPAGNPRRYLRSKAGVPHMARVNDAVLAASNYEGALARRKTASSPRCAEMAELFAACKARVSAIGALTTGRKPVWEK